MPQPLAREAILMCAIPTSAFATLLAPRYGVYETEAASTLVLTTIAMIVVHADRDRADRGM